MPSCYVLQGVVLDCSALEFETMAVLPDAPTAADAAAGGRLPVWLCLDEVMDPVSDGLAGRCGMGLEGWQRC